MLQRETFLSGEGDAWHQRNSSAEIDNASDPVIAGLLQLQLRPRSILEIGCASGKRLRNLAALTSAECHGLDPSSEAIEEARATSPGTYHVGTADALPLPDKSVDLLIFGFCLYLTDPAHHFRIAAEADRVLNDRGTMCIYDFAPGRSYRNAYVHKPGVYSHKMDFAALFVAHPSYRLLTRRYAEHGSFFTLTADDAVAADFLLKDTAAAFPDRAGA